MPVLQPHVATESSFVGVKHHPHRLVHGHANLVIGVAVSGVEVEHEEEVSTLKGDHLVTLVFEDNILMFVAQETIPVLAGVHELVEVLEEVVSEVVGVGQVPSASAMVVAPAVLGAREIDPLRVAELVAHEGQVAFATQGQDDKPDHLVEGQTAVDAEGVIGALDEAHASVHLGIHEPEGQGLVSHNGLIVGLAIGDDLLLVSSIREDVHDVTHVPLVVAHLLQQLDEHVGDGHGQSVVEAKATIGHRSAERGHATDIFADSHSTGHEVVDEVVGQHQVNVALDVRIWTEVLVIATSVAFADAVGVVQHRGDAIEAETIEAVLLQPPSHVGKQEPQDLVLRVVEDLRVPLRMMPLEAAVRVAVVSAVHLRDAVQGVGGAVGVHEIDEDLNAQGVGSVDHLLHLLGCARAARRGEEGRDMVAEAAVVGMLCHGHELHSVVAHALDPWQDITSELQIGGHLRLGGRHANVGLVNLQRVRSGRARIAEGVPLVGRWLPEDTVEEVRGVVLPGQLRPGRDTVMPRAVARLQADFHLHLVLDRASGQLDSPTTEALTLQRRGVLPAIELTNEEDLFCVRQPLSVDVAAIPFGAGVEAKDLVAKSEVLNAAFVLLQLALPMLVAVDSVPDLTLHLPQLGIQIEDSQRHGTCSSYAANQVCQR
mmetsp:Transcript_15557/g.33794  ORF Transcript_15557/g.33794 Transcript_15557/m.33794 type:complete len:656 (+) Transcript_15557:2686-4653(+)